MNKLFSFFHLLKRIFYIFFVQYHGRIPKPILQMYINKLKTELKKITHGGQLAFDPDQKQDYHKYLSFFSPLNPISNEHVFTSPIQIVEVHSPCEVGDVEYVCVVDTQVTFYQRIHLDGKHDAYYFDHDYIEHQQPVFKPDFSKYLFYGTGYIGPLLIVRKEIYERCKQHTTMFSFCCAVFQETQDIFHIATLAYGIDGPYQMQLENVDGANIKPKENYQVVHFPIHGQPLVSIIIPTRDHVDVLKTCIDSIVTKTTYPHYEILILNNGSSQTTSLHYFHEITSDRIQVIDVDMPFNFSRINNYGVKFAKGEYLLFLNNDTEVMEPDWLEKMLGYAQQKDVGSVGTLLLYPDQTIQHGGIIAGKGGVAAHKYYRKPQNVKDYLHTLHVPNEVAGCTMACLLVPKQVFHEVGGLNEELQVNFNDVDFAYRLLEHGYVNIFMPNVRLYHYESKSRGMDVAKEKLERYMMEIQYMQEHWAKYVVHDPYYSDVFDKSYDYQIAVPKEPRR